MKFLRHCRESKQFWWRSLLFTRNVLCCAGKECSIERGGLEFPKQLNCSGKCFFEVSGKDSNPITPQLTTLSEERPQKSVDSILGPSIRDTPLQCALAPKCAVTARVKMEHPGWIPLSLHRGKIPQSFRLLQPRRGVEPSLQHQDLFFYGISSEAVGWATR